MICLDCETDGLYYKSPLVSIGFTSRSDSIAFPVNHPEQENTEREALDKIQRIINKTDLIINHNIKFDLKFLMYNGITFNHRPLLVDTQVLWWLYTGHVDKQISLDNLSKKVLNKEKVKGVDFKKRKASEYPLKELLHYNKIDTQLPFEIYKKLIGEIPDELIHFYSELTYLLLEIEINGIHVDLEVLQEMQEQTASKIDELSKELLSLLEYPINMGSPQQLSCALYGGSFTVKEKKEVRKKYAKWPIWRWKTISIEKEITLKGLGFGTTGLKQTASGYWPTGKQVLVHLRGRSNKAKEWLEIYKQFNNLSALYSKFISPYTKYVDKEDSCIHANFNMPNTLTGRLSCNEPNIQQQSAGGKGLPNVKRIFNSRFENGVILDVDFSGAEWRHAAWRSQDKQMIQDIVDGLDAHTTTAMGRIGCAYDEVTPEQRQDAKPINFRFLYGGGPYGFWKSHLVSSVEEGQAYIDGIYKRFPDLKRSHDRDKAVARAKGKLVMPSGRWYDYSGDRYKDSYVLNYPNQGSSSDMTVICIMEAYKGVKKLFGDRAILVNTVHDCCVFDCVDEDTAIEVHKYVSNIFKNAHVHVQKVFKNMDLSSVPMAGESECGPSWGDMKKIH